jgi:hypothetical protein
VLLAENVVSAAPPSLLAETANVGLLGTASITITGLSEGVLDTMFLNKLKLAVAFILVFGIVAGTGIGAYYLHAQDAARKAEDPFQKRNEAAPEKKAAGKSEDRLHKLLKERRDKATRALQVRMQLYKAGSNEPGTGAPVTLQMLNEYSRNLLKAEVELSTDKKEKLKAHERHLKQIQETAKITEAMYKVGRVGEATLVSVQYEALDAEIELEREKAR